MRASPQGEVLMYRWNWTFSFSLKPCLFSHLVKMDLWCSSSWLLQTQMCPLAYQFTMSTCRRNITFDKNKMDFFNTYYSTLVHPTYRTSTTMMLVEAHLNNHSSIITCLLFFKCQCAYSPAVVLQKNLWNIC